LVSPSKEISYPTGCFTIHFLVLSSVGIPPTLSCVPASVVNDLAVSAWERLSKKKFDFVSEPAVENHSLFLVLEILGRLRQAA